MRGGSGSIFLPLRKALNRDFRTGPSCPLFRSPCAPCRRAQEMFAWVRYSKGSGREDKTIRLDIDLCDQRGNVCVQMRGLALRVPDSGATRELPRLSGHFDFFALLNKERNAP